MKRFLTSVLIILIGIGLTTLSLYIRFNVNLDYTQSMQWIYKLPFFIGWMTMITGGMILILVGILYGGNIFNKEDK